LLALRLQVAVANKNAYYMWMKMKGMRARMISLKSRHTRCQAESDAVSLVRHCQCLVGRRITTLTRLAPHPYTRVGWGSAVGKVITVRAALIIIITIIIVVLISVIGT
jgi:hypothetical protein